MKIMFAVSLVSFICLTGNLSKAEIIVDPSGNGDYTTISESSKFSATAIAHEFDLVALDDYLEASEKYQRGEKC